MARTEIKLPDKFDFSTEVSIRIGDINRAMHMGHERFLVIIEEARAQFLRKYGYTEIDVKGAGLIMTDACIVYLKQALYGQTLRVDIAITSVTSRGFDMVYRVSDSKTGEESARMKTGFLFFDYAKQKIGLTPQAFRDKFAKQP
jgi:acyl-CoA thioester hydrolase